MPRVTDPPYSQTVCTARRGVVVRLAAMTGVAALGLGLVGCSDYHRARRAYEVGRFTEALQILEKLAEGGDAKAQYEIALMYLQGIGTRVDPARGGYWMLAAANNGNVVAMVEIGGRFESVPTWNAITCCRSPGTVVRPPWKTPLQPFGWRDSTREVQACSVTCPVHGRGTACRVSLEIPSHLSQPTGSGNSWTPSSVSRPRACLNS